MKIIGKDCDFFGKPVKIFSQVIHTVIFTGLSPDNILSKSLAGAHITTIEKYQPRIVAAKENFRLAGMEDAITLMEGDADKVLEQLSGTFDFIFMDAAKGQYIHWLPRILELMAEGALLVTDNVLQDGDVAESRFAVERRNRTIHARMRDYLYTLTHMEELKTSIVPIGDGVASSVKILRREP